MAKRAKEVKIIQVKGNSFGDQLIELLVDGEVVLLSNPEGEHIDNIHGYINRVYKPVSVESSGATALNRIFG